MRRRKGSNAVEFALLLPVLLTVVTGGIDYGLWLGDRITIVNAAREGARAAAVTAAEDDPAGVAEAIVAQTLAEEGFRGDADVSVSFEGTAPQRIVRVRVDADWNAPVGFVPTPDALEATVVMRYEDQDD